MRRNIWIGFTVAGLLVASLITYSAPGVPAQGTWIGAHDPIDPLMPKEEVVIATEDGSTDDTQQGVVVPMATDPVDPWG